MVVFVSAGAKVWIRLDSLLPDVSSPAGLIPLGDLYHGRGLHAYINIDFAYDGSSMVSQNHQH